MHGGEQQLDEGDRLVARCAAALLEAEEFLELVDQHQDVVGVRQARLADAIDETAGAAAQRGFQEQSIELGEFAAGAEYLGRVERARQVADRRVPGAQDGDPPARAGARHVAAVERRDQSGPHQRGLAAARTADDREEAIAAQPPQQFVDLPLAAEEQVVFVRFEGPQAGKRIEGGRLGGMRRCCRGRHRHAVRERRA